ncbi:MAG: ATP synthase F1 subunit epsilon [Rhodospirillaceae bacterium]
MADKIDFELVAPEKLIISDQFSMVVIPGSDGDFGVLPHHSPLISTVRAGVIDVYQAESIEKRLFVSGGFAEVSKNRCTVLADEVISLADADIEAANARLAEAQDALEKAADEAARDTAERELEIARSLISALSD